MKKLLIALLSLVMSVGIMAACDVGDNTVPGGTPKELTLQTAEEAYKNVSEAIKIEQKIEIKAGPLLRYGKQKTYTKSGESYRVKETVTRLNDLTADEAYSTEEKAEYTVGAAETPEFNFDLKEEYFTSVTIDSGVVTCAVKDEQSVLSLFGIEDLPAPVYGMTIKITSDTEVVSKLEITYTSGSSDVTIEIAYTYPEKA